MSPSTISPREFPSRPDLLSFGPIVEGIPTSHSKCPCTKMKQETKVLWSRFFWIEPSPRYPELLSAAVKLEQLRAGSTETIIEDAGPNALNYLRGIEQLDKAVGCIDDTYHAQQRYIDLASYFDAILHPDLVWNTQSGYKSPEID
ncbi:hypothetical protein N7499_008129 [Penicillium canescens]|nr:hypothetical protein N7499_008129 [Penicillium canescens]KAJ6158460.1 hypothetical protein N7485_011286 [Penicillium canescens]